MHGDGWDSVRAGRGLTYLFYLFRPLSYAFEAGRRRGSARYARIGAYATPEKWTGYGSEEVLRLNGVKKQTDISEIGNIEGLRNVLRNWNMHFGPYS